MFCAVFDRVRADIALNTEFVTFIFQLKFRYFVRYSRIKLIFCAPFHCRWFLESLNLLFSQ